MELETLYIAGLFGSRRYYNHIFDPSLHYRSSPFRHSCSVPRKSVRVRIFCSGFHGSEFVGDEVMQMFAKDRQINGDLVSKIYDNLWRKDDLQFADKEVIVGEEHIHQIDLELKGDGIEIDDGFLKLSKTMEWVSSENIAPINKKFATMKREDDGKKRKKVNNLKYEVLKGELLLLTVGIGAACAVYCLISLSIETAISYSVGVLLSCLYLQLLCTYTDNLSKKYIPRIFIQKKVKKIGIRSDDLVNNLEKTLNGTSMALSSPRLVIPAAIYGLWALSHQYFNLFDFQEPAVPAGPSVSRRPPQADEEKREWAKRCAEIVPAMAGFFAYKAAALVQIYRDNENLGIVFPDSQNSNSDLM